MINYTQIYLPPNAALYEILSSLVSKYNVKHLQLTSHEILRIFLFLVLQAVIQ